MQQGQGREHPIPTASVCSGPGQSSGVSQPATNSREGQGATPENKMLAWASTKVPPLQHQRQTRLNRTNIHSRQIKPLQSRAAGIAKSCRASENQQQKHQTQQKKMHKGRVNGTKRRMLLKEDIAPSKETTKDFGKSK